MPLKEAVRGNCPVWETLGLSNLFLEHSDLSLVGDDLKTLAPEYTLRTTDFNEKDIQDLVETLDLAFGDQHGTWDVTKLHVQLIDEAQVKRTFVVEYTAEDGSKKVVGTASARVNHEKFLGKGYLHWVAVHPSHQGQGIASVLTSAVLRELRDGQAQTKCVLETQDTSLPALKTYLSLGFRGHVLDDSHPARWAVVAEKLSRDLADCVV